METPPVPVILKINYQIPRDVLIRIWWKRMILRPLAIAEMTIMLAAVATFCFVIRAGIQIAGFALLSLLIMTPISIYRVLAKVVDGNSQHTDPQTLEFTSSRLIITGPNWKIELPRTTFRGFSEDATYFYLRLSPNGFSVIPKSAFTPELEQKFRDYAKAGHA